MPFRKIASGILCVVVLIQASALWAGGNPPPPVPRPASPANRAQYIAQPEAPPSDLTLNNLDPHNLDQVLLPQVLLPQVLGSAERAVIKTYQALIKREAEKNGLPYDIADAVAAIESGYDPSALGGAGEIGLMQVRPETAAMLGFKGGLAELAEPDVNIHYGVTYLGQAWHLAKGDLCRTLMKYRAGHGEEMMSALSANYCGRARAHLAAGGSRFAAGVSVPVVFEPAFRQARVAKRGPRLRTAAVSRVFWAAEEARVKAITARVESKWKHLASR
jgi:soluble lytic murein transglycosylase-like protein